MDSTALKNCFGWSEGTGWPPEETETVPGTPHEVVRYCDPPPATGDDCTMQLYEGFVDLHNECGCASEDDFGFGCECCTFPTGQEVVFDTEWQAGGASLLAALESCLIEVPALEPLCDEQAMNLETCGVLSEEACSLANQIGAPSAELHVQLDPMESFILLQAGSNSDQVALYGNGAVNSSPTGFLRAVAWPDDAQVGNVNFNDWTFYLDSPISIDMTGGGNFVVDAGDGPGFYGYGTINSGARTATVPLGEDASGKLNFSSMTWHLDYEEQVGNQSVEVHMEGPMQWVD